MDAEYLDAFQTILEADYSGTGLADSYRTIDEKLDLLVKDAPNRALKDYFTELHSEVSTYHDGFRDITRKYRDIREDLDERCEPGNIHKGVQVATPLGMATYGFITGLAGGPLVAILTGGLGLVAGYLTDMYVVEGAGTVAINATEKGKLSSLESEHRPALDTKLADGQQLYEAFEEAYFFDKTESTSDSEDGN
jgi:hypothetical protein